MKHLITLLIATIILSACSPLLTIYCEPYDALIEVDDVVTGQGIVKYRPPCGQKIVKVSCTKDSLNYHISFIQISHKNKYHTINIKNF